MKNWMSPIAALKKSSFEYFVMFVEDKYVCVYEKGVETGREMECSVSAF